jgi:thioredoxin reductase (NADPH)
MHDVVIIGAGPVGLACAIEATRAGLSAIVFDKGALTNSIVGYPARMEFFSTPDLIEIGGHPFPVQGYKPTREEGLEYYRSVAAREALDVRLYERVTALRGQRGAFTVVTPKGEYPARHVIVAVGFYDSPNPLGVPGEDLPHVSHYYREPFPYVGQKVAIVGAKNSAAKAALECHRHGAEVTLVIRGAGVSEKVKYWIRPDLENRVQEGSIAARLRSRVLEIRPGSAVVEGPGGRCELPADAVLLLTGYHPDVELLRAAGVTVDPQTLAPRHDPQTFETDVPGLFVAGSLSAGLQTNRIFIETGRFHGEAVARAVQARRRGTSPAEKV